MGADRGERSAAPVAGRASPSTGRRRRVGVPPVLRTVRVRAALAAVAVVGCFTAAGVLVLVVLLRDMLTDGIMNAAELRAADVATAYGPGGGEIGSPKQDDEEFIQVLAPDGTVLAASANVAGRPALADVPVGESRMVPNVIDDQPFAVAAVGIPEGRLVVLAGRTVERIAETTAAVTGMLAIGLPALLAVIAVTTWLLVGRSLAPVEAMRREVDAISAAELNRRVADPPGEDEVARLARTMNRMLDRLEQAQTRQRRFVSDASHELRSPVAAIRQHAEVALAHPDRAGSADLAATVLAEDLRMQRLVEDLLVLARADEHSLRLNRRPVDLDDLVFAEARRLRDGNGVRVDTTAVSAGRVLGDVAGLRRAVANLTENAARHAGSRVRVSLREGTVGAVLTVEDDGPGIPPADRARVLERFVRLDEARTRDSGGSGLGLAIVDEIVRAHGGRLAIGDSPLGGARVELIFPQASDGPDGDTTSPVIGQQGEHDER